jgi:hypothetical protein
METSTGLYDFIRDTKRDQRIKRSGRDMVAEISGKD